MLLADNNKLCIVLGYFNGQHDHGHNSAEEALFDIEVCGCYTDYYWRYPLHFGLGYKSGMLKYRKIYSIFQGYIFN